MAYIGLRKPIIYPLDSVNAGNYMDGVAFGKAVSFSMTPNIAEAQLYGDDILAESEKAVTSATLSLGTTDVPDACKKTMFGHKEESGSGTYKEYTYNVDDNPEYVGFAVIGVKKVDGGGQNNGIYWIKKAYYLSVG